MLPSTYPVLDLPDAPRFDGDGERDRLRLLAEVSESIASHRDLNELFRDLAQRLPRIVPFDYINVVLHDPVRNVMRLRLLAAPVDSTIQPGRGVPRRRVSRRLCLEDTAAVHRQRRRTRDRFRCRHPTIA